MAKILKKDPAFMPFRFNIWTFWCHEDLLSSSGKVLLEGHVPGCYCRLQWIMLRLRITIVILQVTQCPQCQQMNKKLDIVQPKLFPVPVKSLWHHVGKDFDGTISSASRNGNRFILTISDYFTKFAWAKALPTKWFPELELSYMDREIILSLVGWVTDSIINTAQTLLKDMYPVSDIESVACGLTMTYSVQRSEFIQMLQ